MVVHMDDHFVLGGKGMMNEKRLNLLQQVMINDLAEEINKHKEPDEKIEPTEEAVFANLKSIYEEKKQIEFGQETGNSYRYMPKQYKKMVMRLISPECMFSHKTITTETAVTDECYLFITNTDEKPVATGKATVTYSSVIDESMGEYEKKLYCEATAKGLAESKALQDFGIGSWYSYQFEAEENPDEAVANMTEKAGTVPKLALEDNTESSETSGSNIEEKSIKEEGSKENLPDEDKKENETDDEVTKVQSAFENAMNVTTEEAAQEMVSDTEPENTEQAVEAQVSKDVTISYEEALDMPAEVGKASSRGWTLGYTAEKYPHNIIWMYKNSGEISDAGKAALVVIAKNNSVVAADFAANGVNLETLV